MCFVCAETRFLMVGSCDAIDDGSMCMWSWTTMSSMLVMVVVVVPAATAATAVAAGEMKQQ